MKTLIVTLIAALALIVPTTALADGGEIVLPTTTGTLNYQVSDNPVVNETQQFAFSITVPVDEGILNATNNDLRHTSAGDLWPNLYVNLKECTRIIFDTPAPAPVGDTGWHCTYFSNGHPASPALTDLPLTVDDTVAYAGIGRECPLTDDPKGSSRCNSPGVSGNEHPYHFPEVDLTPFFGTAIPGSLYAHVSVQLGWTPNYGEESLTPVGQAGTITEVGGSLASFNSVATLEGPSAFVLKTTRTLRAGFDCQIPKVLGLSKVKAAARLKANHCKVKFHSVKAPRHRGKVVTQPKVGRLFLRNHVVNLKVGR